VSQVDSDPEFKPVNDMDIAAGYDDRLGSITVPAEFMRLAAELKNEYDLALWQVMLR
jgi:hypothetical protein